MSRRISLSSPDVGDLEQEFVVQALRSGWAAPVGPDLDAFEREVAERTDRKYAVGLSSGTAALHLALVHWGVEPGDVVPVSTFTFAATVNAIRYVGAEPHFVDCDPITGNIDPHLLRNALEQLHAEGRTVPVVIPVDMLGKSADYTHIGAVLADYPHIRLLADAAESFGSQHDGNPAGSFGDAAVLSFNGNKVMTTSGGGMLLTDDEDMALHVRKLSTQAREPVVHYEHTEVGYNYRLSNILAALGRAQLRRLEDMIARRRQWRSGYQRLIDGVDGIRILGGDDAREDNCWLTALVIDAETLGWSADGLAADLTAAGIESRPVWKPMHLQPIFEDRTATLNGASELLFSRGITLPSGSAMNEQDFARVCAVVQGRLAGPDRSDHSQSHGG